MNAADHAERLATRLARIVDHSSEVVRLETVPEDSYAMSKVAGEVTARSFHARTGADVYGLRINNVSVRSTRRTMPMITSACVRESCGRSTSSLSCFGALCMHSGTSAIRWRMSTWSARWTRSTMSASV